MDVINIRELLRKVTEGQKFLIKVPFILRNLHLWFEYVRSSKVYWTSISQRTKTEYHFLLVLTGSSSTNTWEYFGRWKKSRVRHSLLFEEGGPPPITSVSTTHFYDRLANVTGCWFIDILLRHNTQIMTHSPSHHCFHSYPSNVGVSR